MLVAPDRRISSLVITWIAEAVSESLSRRFETEVTSTFINSSTLNALSGRVWGVWANAVNVAESRIKQTNSPRFRVVTTRNEGLAPILGGPEFPCIVVMVFL